MKRTWCMGALGGIVICAVIFGLGATLQANSGFNPAGGKVACVDVIRIYNEYQRQKDLAEEAQQIEQDMQNEMERRRGALDSLQATLDAMDPADPTYGSRQRELLAMQIDFKNWMDLMQADMGREVGIWTRRIYEETMIVLEKQAQQFGYDMVMYRDAPGLVGFEPESIQNQIRQRRLLYVNPQTDITQQVLDELNAQYRAQPRAKMLQVSPTP